MIPGHYWSKDSKNRMFVEKDFQLDKAHIQPVFVLTDYEQANSGKQANKLSLYKYQFGLEDKTFVFLVKELSHQRSSSRNIPN